MKKQLEFQEIKKGFSTSLVREKRYFKQESLNIGQLRNCLQMSLKNELFVNVGHFITKIDVNNGQKDDVYINRDTRSSEMNGICFSPCERFLYCSAQTDHFFVYRIYVKKDSKIKFQKIKTKMVYHYDMKSYGNSTCVSNDGSLVAVSTDDCGAYVFQNNNGNFKCIHQIKRTTESDFVHFSCGNKYLVISGGNYLTICNTRNWEDIKEIHLFDGFRCSLAKFSPIRDDIFCYVTFKYGGKKNGHINLCSVVKENPTSTILLTHEVERIVYATIGMTWSTDGKKIYVSDNGKGIHEYHVRRRFYNNDKIIAFRKELKKTTNYSNVVIKTY